MYTWNSKININTSEIEAKNAITDEKNNHYQKINFLKIVTETGDNQLQGKNKHCLESQSRLQGKLYVSGGHF